MKENRQIFLGKCCQKIPKALRRVRNKGSLRGNPFVATRATRASRPFGDEEQHRLIFNLREQAVVLRGRKQTARMDTGPSKRRQQRQCKKKATACRDN